MSQFLTYNSLVKDAFAYFKFDGDSNGLLGPGVSATQNITYVTGKINQGANFNGSNSLVQTGLNHKITSKEPFTVCGWYKYGGTNTGVNPNQVIVSNYQGNPVPYNIYAEDTGVFRCDSRDNASVSFSITGSTNIRDGNWHFFGVQRDTNNYYLYTDGNLEATKPYNLGDITVSNNIVFGQLNFFFGEGFVNGVLDEVGFWRRCLSGNEIRTLYNNNIGSQYPFNNGNKIIDYNSLIKDSIAYYKLDGNSIDSTGNHSGTTDTAVYVNGVINQGTSFIDQSQYIAMPYSTDFDLTNSITISAWLKSSIWIENTYAICRLGTSVGANGWDMSTGPFTNAIGGYFRSVNGGNSFGVGYFIQVPAVYNGNWHHIVLTLGSDRVKIYIDGNINGIFNSSGSMPPSEVGIPLTLGKPSPPYGNNFVGSIDEVGIWKRALSANEVLQLYNNGRGNQFPFKR